jgi:predicted HTH transcriptional regulator
VLLNESYLMSLVDELLKYPNETEWLEFKVNDSKPDAIGEYISALSNSAAIENKPCAYVIWGVQDEDHAIVGTTFNPDKVKMGNENLENWLHHLIKPNINFNFYKIEKNEKNLVILQINRAEFQPTQFKKEKYIRLGSYKKALKDHPEKEKMLWRCFDTTPFEKQIAIANIDDVELLMLLDYPSYFKLLKQPLPETRCGILDALAADLMIQRSSNGKWDILKQGAILFASKLSDFEVLRRKAIRVILYKDDNKLETKHEQEGYKGYASGFEGLVEFINRFIPSNEVIGEALRANVPMYPPLAVRELVANALIHQDFSIMGCGLLVEIFNDRMEITNPGKPLIKVDRFLNNPPRSRNEALASFMRRVGVCEERGSGIDKIVAQTELFQLPAPKFEMIGENTKVTLFAHRAFKDMDKTDRIRACYLHACLKYVDDKKMTNSSLRERFGIKPESGAMASRIIKDALQAELIKSYGGDSSRKHMKYVPYWAS